MPLGNLTSQFFANVYLNELDYFVKHDLKAKHYIRYVDDFVILSNSKALLEFYKSEIEYFLKTNLAIQLHPSKTKIFSLKQGTTFLGFRIFPHHKLLKKKNLSRFNLKFKLLEKQYQEKSTSYDKIYDFLEGWLAYTMNADTYKLRIKILSLFESSFREVSTKEVNRFLKSIKPCSCQTRPS